VADISETKPIAISLSTKLNAAIKREPRSVRPGTAQDFLTCAQKNEQRIQELQNRRAKL